MSETPLLILLLLVGWGLSVLYLLHRQPPVQPAPPEIGTMEHQLTLALNVLSGFVLEVNAAGDIFSSRSSRGEKFQGNIRRL